MKNVLLLIYFVALLAVGCKKADSLCHDCDGMFSEDVTVFVNNR